MIQNHLNLFFGNVFFNYVAVQILYLFHIILFNLLACEIVFYGFAQYNNFSLFLRCGAINIKK